MRQTHKRSWLANVSAVAAGTFCALISLQSPLAAQSTTGLTVWPAEVRLNDALAAQQLLASVPGDLDAVDVTREAEFLSADLSIAQVDGHGKVTPVAQGTTSIRIRAAGQEAAVSVTVGPLDTQRPVDFAREIVPLLTRYGCNSGGCHGKASGQNGFKLSLFGFDAQFDYDALTKQARGRRVFPAAPEQSLVLAKAIGATAHGGGRRFDEDSEAYQTLYRWIAQGLPSSDPEAAVLVGVSIEPRRRTLRPLARQQLAVTAVYSDGTTRDVTTASQFESNHETVAIVDEDGCVTVGEQTGEAAVMARYQGQVAVFSVLAPYAAPLTELPGFTPKNFIDELAAAKWRALGIQPSPNCDDATFLRRVSLDLCGRLPTVDEVLAFAADTSPDKRAQAIDRLLDSPEYAAYWAMNWGEILRNSQDAGAANATYAFQDWLRDMLARNRPYTEIVRGVLCASGTWLESPGSNWYWQTRDDPLNQVTADAAQVFLGLRLQCAQCHHHPYERWSQDDFFGLAGFFNRVQRKGEGEPPGVFPARQVSVGGTHPRTGTAPDPKYLDGESFKPAPWQDVRQLLVDWMAKPENPFFARALVNRLWGKLLSRGIVEPVDDLRETNPPANPELLAALADDFISHGFDLRHVLRTITNSQVYQLSSEPLEANRRDQQNFARYYARRLPAEVMLDAVDQACGSRSGFGGTWRYGHAVDLPHEGFGSFFLDTFGRPKRVSACDCARSSGANLSQVLLLANSDEIENKLRAGGGRIEQLLATERPAAEIVGTLYLAALNRQPTSAEIDRCIGYLEQHSDRRQAAEDLLWALLNTREFAFNH